jgi:hypothetical protein
MSLGVVAEKPNESQLQELERLQGQIDAMVPTLAALAGVPESDFQSAGANNIDLKAFGNQVVQNKNNIETLSEDGSPGTPLLATATIAGAQKLNKIQTKIMSGDHTTDVAIPELTFNNLIVGKWYEIRAQFAIEATASESAIGIVAQDGAEQVGKAFQHIRQGSGTLDEAEINLVIATVFKATTDTLEFIASNVTGDRIVGTGTRNHTFAQLEERNDLIETSDFT